MHQEQPATVISKMNVINTQVVGYVCIGVWKVYQHTLRCIRTYTQLVKAIYTLKV